MAMAWAVQAGAMKAARRLTEGGGGWGLQRGLLRFAGACRCFCGRPSVPNSVNRGRSYLLKRFHSADRLIQAEKLSRPRTHTVVLTCNLQVDDPAYRAGK